MLKLVAPLAGVALDELIQRDAQRSARRLAEVVAASACGLAVLGGLGALLVQARARAADERARGDHLIADMVGPGRAELLKLGRLTALDRQNNEALSYFKDRDRSELSDQEVAWRAELLRDMAQDDIGRGDFKSAEAKARAALADTSSLLAARPNDPDRVYGQAQSEFYVGAVRWNEGEDAAAQAAFSAYAAFADRLMRLKPGDPDARLEAAYAASNLGTLLLQRNMDTARAGALFAAAQPGFEAAARLHPDEPDLQVQVLDGYGWLADVARLRGQYVDALKLRMQQKALLATLLPRYHRDADIEARVVSTDLGVGRVQSALGDWRRALATLQQAHDAGADLADNDPTHLDNARELRAIELFQARTLLSKPDPRRSRAQIASLLGDCGAEQAQLKSTELASFCTILHARALAAFGDRPAAAAQLSKLNPAQLSHGHRLSDDWLINWQEEMAM